MVTKRPKLLAFPFFAPVSFSACRGEEEFCAPLFLRTERNVMQSTLIAPETRPHPTQSDERAGKYLTFMVGKEEFGAGVLKVREIMGVRDITTMPQTPPYMKGVIDLRGKVTPVIDLCAIVVQVKVVQVKNGTASLVTGMVVDEVSEVIAVAGGDIGRHSGFWCPGRRGPYHRDGEGPWQRENSARHRRAPDEPGNPWPRSGYPVTDLA
jgi:hypothetical protein